MESIWTLLFDTFCSAALQICLQDLGHEIPVAPWISRCREKTIRTPPIEMNQVRILIGSRGRITLHIHTIFIYI